LHHASDLRELDHPDVRKKATENAQKNKARKKKQNGILLEGPEGGVSVGPPISSDADVLIAEIPKGGPRWNQANFDLETFRNFFGASPGRTQRVIMTHVDIDGRLGPQEVRPSVSVKSHNYRFELDAAGNLTYPRKGRPIAVFVRVATRTFRYRLFMPGSQGYQEVNVYLKGHEPGRANRVRRYRTNVGSLGGLAFFRRLAE
jgi:hypothetical protein